MLMLRLRRRGLLCSIIGLGALEYRQDLDSASHRYLWGEVHGILHHAEETRSKLEPALLPNIPPQIGFRGTSAKLERALLLETTSVSHTYSGIATSWECLNLHSVRSAIRFESSKQMFILMRDY